MTAGTITMKTSEAAPGITSPPLAVSDASEIAWDEEADVVVVGFGGAGVVAAIEASENGAEVLAVDRFGGGGATAYSGGVFYAGGGTRHQRDAGVEDPPEEMFNYLAAEGSAVAPETLRRFCDGSSDDLLWLEAHGVPYGGNPYLKKTAFPPDPHWLYYSGNEMLPAFASQAVPAPRGHRPVSPGFGGHLHYAKLRESALQRGIRVLEHAPVKRLIVDRDANVIGVELNQVPQALWARHSALHAIVSPWKPLNAEKAERAIVECRAFEAGIEYTKRIRARAGVILATGGFVNNLDMLGQYRGLLAKSYAGLTRLGSMGCDGSGILLGQSVGGSVGLMDRMFLGRSITPPDAFVYGLIVNYKGERFVSEDAYNAVIGDAISGQPDGKAWLILDRDHFWRGVKQSVFPGKGMFLLWGVPALLNVIMGGTRSGRNLRALAKKCGVDAAGLEQTFNAFNETAKSGAPDSFGRAPDKMYVLTGAPFYAVNVSLNNKYGATWAFSLGGLIVDERTGEVMREGGTVINGLYAAGRTAVGLCSQGYMSGLSIADTVFSGRRAGCHAARKVNKSFARYQAET
jgi:3-oxo-5alpha-steroid 4-dehydrogenase